MSRKSSESIPQIFSKEIILDSDSNILTITGDGVSGSGIQLSVDSIGIGTPNPLAKLHINGANAGFETIILQTTASAGKNVIRFKSSPNTNQGYIGYGSSTNDQLTISNEAGDQPITFYTSGTTGQTEKLRITSEGNVGIGTTGPTQTLDVNGTVRVRTFSATAGAGTVYRLTDGTLSLTAPSDMRFKKDISTIENALDKVTSLRGVKFKWDDTQVPEGDFGIDPAVADKFRIGVIAQEIKDVIPEVIFTHQQGKDYLGVSYPELTAVLIEAVKELKSQVDSLKTEIEVLKSGSI